jgi:curved DNA-binding protein CbpA
MEVSGFIDYYEILDVSPNADIETIERKFRSLALRYHPDNQASGDRHRFDLVLEAHSALRDAERRARYHRDHQHYFDARWPPAEDAGAGETAKPAEGPGEAEGAAAGEAPADDHGIARDVDIQNRLLTLLYLRRRRNIREPGIGDAELERMSGCPPEHLEFHVWYMKEKGWIRRGDDGMLTITIDGVDRATHIHQTEAAKKLITDQS